MLCIRLAVFLALVGLLSGCGSSTPHPVASGSVSGHVLEASRNPSAAGSVEPPLSGATVTLTGGGKTRSTVTTATGLFKFSRLAPGHYQLRASWTTACSVTTTVTLNAGKQANLRLLCFGAVS